MNYDTHVYLGPTLPIITAKKILPNAHYHPPIQCGDIIRVLRLKPKRLIIIDGIYETTPTVWHKEIMLALDNGIEVIGAASMGALRAAELSPFGMIGIGAVFQDFFANRLQDDDEVAVLHHHHDQKYIPINDAMVNIRATLTHVYHKHLISSELKNRLITECKQQFYPYRSLEKAISQLEPSLPERSLLLSWLSTHGLVNVKQQDAIQALTHVRQTITLEPTRAEPLMPVTKFIASLIDDAELEPFAFTADWMPDQEKKLQQWSQQGHFQLIQILAIAIKWLFSRFESTAQELDCDRLLQYIQTNNLYSPENDLDCLKQSVKCQPLYALICQLICQGHLTHHSVMHYAPAMAFYFQLDYDDLSMAHQQIIRIIIVCCYAATVQLEDKRLKLKQSVIANHFREQRLWQRRDAYLKQNPTRQIDQYALIEWVTLYMQVAYVYQGFRDTHLGSPTTPQYFDWIHDAATLYDHVVFQSTI